MKGRADKRADSRATRPWARTPRVPDHLEPLTDDVQGAEVSVVPRLGRGVRWSDVVADIERDRLLSESAGEAEAA